MTRREPTAAVAGMDLRAQRSLLDTIRRRWKDDGAVDPGDALGTTTAGAFAVAFVQGTIAKRRAKRARQKDAALARKGGEG